MRKWFVLLCILVFVCLVGFAPIQSWYIDVTTTQLGEIRIYVPSSTQLSLNGDIPVNITGSTVTGYVLDSSGEREYQITISPYGEPWEYRRYSGSWGDTNPLTVTAIDVDTSTLSIQGASLRFDPDTVFYIGLLLLVVCIPFVVRRS